MTYYLTDKNQNDGVLAHASKYAGGFTKDGDNTPEYNHNYYIENREKILAKRRQRRDTEKTQASGSKPSAKPIPSASNFVKTNRGERPIGNSVKKSSKTRGASGKYAYGEFNMKDSNGRDTKRRYRDLSELARDANNPNTAKKLYANDNGTIHTYNRKTGKPVTFREESDFDEALRKGKVVGFANNQWERYMDSRNGGKTRGATRSAASATSKGPDRVSTKNAQVENYIASTKKHRTPTNSLSDIEKAKKAKKKSGIENAKNFINGLLSKAGKAADEAGRNIGKAAKKASWAIADSAPVQATKKAIKDVKNKADIKSGKKTKAEAYGWQDYAVATVRDKDGRGGRVSSKRVYRDLSEYERDKQRGLLDNAHKTIVGYDPDTGEKRRYSSEQAYLMNRNHGYAAGSDSYQRSVRNRGEWEAKYVTGYNSYTGRDENNPNFYYLAKDPIYGKKKFTNYQEYLKAINSSDYSPVLDYNYDPDRKTEEIPVHYNPVDPSSWPENKKNKKNKKRTK